jgi:tRNA (guanine-N7-)-methyltransferase
MGKNKLQKFKDISEWPHVFELAQYDSVGSDHPLKGRWGSEVFGNEHPLVLELGCGKGEYTVSLAELYPEKNFIGIDIKGARLWTGAKAVKEKALKNAVFIRTHIEFLTRFLARDEVSELWLTFPDPQLKKARKRLTSTRFLALYQQFLKPGGLIHLKTDSPFLYTYTRELIKVNDLPLLVDTDDLYHTDWKDTILSIQTFYESHWLQRGMSIKYLRFALFPKEIWKEPDILLEPDPYRSFGRQAGAGIKHNTL